MREFDSFIVTGFISILISLCGQVLMVGLGYAEFDKDEVLDVFGICLTRFKRKHAPIQNDSYVAFSEEN